jgi:hypothetical protein
MARRTEHVHACLREDHIEVIAKNPADFADLARVAGAVVAQAHARADEHEGGDPESAETRILEAL